jgi:hypothetical protein
MSEIEQPIIKGVVLGTRKAGTTWLYENFRKNPDLRVSDRVKESSYFTGQTALTRADYDALLPKDSMGYAIEVDTSVCYANGAPDMIDGYNPNMHVVLIFRDPARFLTSRFTHSQRKGELKQDTPIDALRQTDWLQQELDYVKIVQRFARFAEAGRLTILPYEMLLDNPLEFHARVLQGLGAPKTEFVPSTERVNVARTSSLPIVSILFSNAAKFARRFGGHGLVNAAKALGLHSKLEKKAAPVTREGSDVDDVLNELCPGTIALHQQLVADVKL